MTGFHSLVRHGLVGLVLTFALLLVAAPAWADPTLDAAASINQNHTLSFTVGSGTNRVLYACVGSTGSQTVTGITYNAVAMDFVDSVTSGSGSTNRQVHLFRMVNPPTGTANLVADTSSEVNSAIAAIAFAGVHQTTPNGATAEVAATTGTSSSINVTSAVGDLVVDCLVVRSPGSDLTAGANQTRQTQFGTGSSVAIGISTEAGAASSTTMSWSWTNSDNRAQLGAAVKPAAAAAGSRGMLLGVGR